MQRYWIWLADRKRLSQGEKLALRQRFSSVQALYAATDYGPDIQGIARNSLLDKDLSAAEKILADCKRRGAQVLTPDDPSYPESLRQIPDPPVVLYYLGKLPQSDREIPIAMVGTRRPSAYGLMAAAKLGGEIASLGGLVVSGVASGIDAESMWGAIRAGKPAVGVLGCGIDVVYPYTNRELYRATERQGCLISEYPPGTRPAQWTFPKRNRIISGLSRGVVVVEAPEKSGTMITAADARRQGRDLFAVPGHIQDANCAGSNRLLASGVPAVVSGRDVMARYLQGESSREKPVCQPAAVTAPSTPQPAKTDLESSVAAVLASLAPQRAPVTEKKPASSPKRAAPSTPPAPHKGPTGADLLSAENRDSAVRMEELSEREQLIVRRLMEAPCTVEDLIRATGLTSSAIRVCLTVMELKGLTRFVPGGRVELI